MAAKVVLENDSLEGIDPTRWGLPLEAVGLLGRQLFDCWDRFHDCCTTRTRDTSVLAHVYLKGLLLLPDERNYANIGRRIIGPDDDGQSLQQFMSDSPWHDQRVFAQIQREISDDSRLRGGVLSLDESGDKRSGELSAGSARQYLGRLGKVDVGQVGVALSYSCEDFWALVDAKLYLPENWFDSHHARLRERLHIPKGLLFSTKPQIGLDLVRRAQSRGLPFSAVAADAVYGRDSDFRAALDKDNIKYIADVPSDYPVYVERPEVGVPPRRSNRGKAPSTPALLNGVESVPAASLVDEKVVWQTVPLRQGERGLVEVTCWARRVWTISNDWEVRQEWLVVHRQSDGKMHCSLSNASADTPLPVMMQWRGQRYFVERTFQDEKSEMGWDELVAQKYRAWMHHAALAALALFFVMSVRRGWAEKYPRSEKLKEEFGVEKLPALSVANIRELLAAVMPLPRFTPDQALVVVIGHLKNRARSTGSRCRKQERQRQATAGRPPGERAPPQLCERLTCSLFSLILLPQPISHCQINHPTFHDSEKLSRGRR
jgi:SRSO17 transposase